MLITKQCRTCEYREYDIIACRKYGLYVQLQKLKQALPIIGKYITVQPCGWYDRKVELTKEGVLKCVKRID